MTLCFTADSSLDGQALRLLTASRGLPARARVADVQPSPYDHVVYTVADLPAPSGGFYDLTTGSWAFAQPITLTSTLRVPVGVTVYLTTLGWQNLITTAAITVLNVGGIVLLDAFAFNSQGNRGVQLSGANAELWADQCFMQANTEVVLASQAAHVQVTNSRWISNFSRGLYVNAGAGAVSRILLSDLKSTTLAGVFLDYNGGAVLSAIVSGCHVECTTGINWAAGSIPVEGLAVVGNHIDWTVAAYGGHTPASARANYKANTDSSAGALITETAIVP